MDLNSSVQSDSTIDANKGDTLVVGVLSNGVNVVLVFTRGNVDALLVDILGLLVALEMANLQQRFILLSSKQKKKTGNHQ
jgi:hypothetical protein